MYNLSKFSNKIVEHSQMSFIEILSLKQGFLKQMSNIHDIGVPKKCHVI
jgi:hypothetical protein